MDEVDEFKVHVEANKERAGVDVFIIGQTKVVNDNLDLVDFPRGTVAPVALTLSDESAEVLCGELHRLLNLKEPTENVATVEQVANMKAVGVQEVLEDYLDYSKSIIEKLFEKLP